MKFTALAMLIANLFGGSAKGHDIDRADLFKFGRVV